MATSKHKKKHTFQELQSCPVYFVRCANHQRDVDFVQSYMCDSTKSGNLTVGIEVSRLCLQY